MSPRTDRLMEFLATEGYRPSLRSNGDIVFKHDGGLYGIRFDPGDEQYFVIDHPDFWRLKAEAEVTRAVQAANRASAGIKVVKVLVLEERREVWATVELFADGTAQFEATFGRILSALRAGVLRFRDEMRASEPLGDARIALARGEVTRFQHGN
jgi:hypothetical protein